MKCSMCGASLGFLRRWKSSAFCSAECAARYQRECADITYAALKGWNERNRGAGVQAEQGREVPALSLAAVEERAEIEAGVEPETVAAAAMESPEPFAAEDAKRTSVVPAPVASEHWEEQMPLPKPWSGHACQPMAEAEIAPTERKLPVQQPVAGVAIPQLGGLVAMPVAADSSTTLFQLVPFVVAPIAPSLGPAVKPRMKASRRRSGRVAFRLSGIPVAPTNIVQLSEESNSGEHNETANMEPPDPRAAIVGAGSGR